MSLIKFLRIPLLIMILVIGTVIGYFIGSSKANQIFLSNVYYIDYANAFKLLNTSPNLNFLSIAVSFEAAVIAFLIPLSINVVSKISERYESEVVIKPFISDWRIKSLPILLISNIVIAVSLRFFTKDSDNELIYVVIIAWIVLLIFLVTALIIISFVKLLYNYISSTDYVLNKLFRDAEKFTK